MNICSIQNNCPYNKTTCCIVCDDFHLCESKCNKLKDNQKHNFVCEFLTDKIGYLPDIIQKEYNENVNSLYKELNINIMDFLK